MYLLLRLQLVAKDAYGWVPLGSFDTDASCSNAAKYLREVKATSVKHFFRIPTTVAKKADIFVRSGKVSARRLAKARFRRFANDRYQPYSLISGYRSHGKLLTKGNYV
jgi:hypothetical protein